MSLTLRGAAAEVRWVYHLAATLGPWTLTTQSETHATVTAQVRTVQAYRLAQRPITFIVPRPTGPPWRWPIETAQVIGDTVTLVVGAAEE